MRRRYRHSLIDKGRYLCRIKLTQADSGAQMEQAEGSHAGHHHYVSLGLVAEVEGNQVRLSATGANAVLFEEEEGD